MKDGEEQIIKRICVSKECENCGEIATKCITFLIAGNPRSNPASSAYGKDDCSWCSDAETFACDKCEDETRRNPPRGLEWCSTFSRKNFEHLFLKWKEEKVTNLEDRINKAYADGFLAGQKQLAQTIEIVQESMFKK